MPTDRDLSQVIINKLTKTQYDSATKSNDEFYFVTDGKISADDVDDTNSTNKFVTASDKTAWNNKQDTSNLVTSISSASTDAQYPSAKCMYDMIGDIETLLQGV